MSSSRLLTEYCISRKKEIFIILNYYCSYLPVTAKYKSLLHQESLYQIAIKTCCLWSEVINVSCPCLKLGQDSVKPLSIGRLKYLLVYMHKCFAGGVLNFLE